MPYDQNSFTLILQHLTERIKSLEDEMLNMAQEIEENRRVASNVIRLGVVTDANNTTVHVKTGKNSAKDLPFFVHAAGRVSHYRRPSVGEQCILLNLGSGDNLNNSVALMGLPSTKFSCPTTAENQVMTDYGNGMTETYDLNNGSLIATYPGGLLVKGDITSSGEVSDKKSSMSADRIIFNSHGHPALNKEPTQEQ